MTKKSKTMLILSCVFVTIVSILFFFDSYVSLGTYSLLFSNPENLGEALGVVFGLIFFVAYTVIIGIAILIFGSITLAFVIPLLKMNGKQWYSLLILIFTAVAMVLAILYVVMIPTVSDAHEAAKAASSSSSEPMSESALLLL